MTDLAAIGTSVATGAISFFAAFFSNRTQIKTVQANNRHEIERLVQKHEFDLQAVEQSHRMELERLAIEHAHQLELKDKDLQTNLSNQMVTRMMEMILGMPETKTILGNAILKADKE